MFKTENSINDILYGNLGPRGNQPDYEQVNIKDMVDGSRHFFDYFGQLFKLEVAKNTYWRSADNGLVIGPATVFLQNGEIHREDGPAIIYGDGTEVWYRQGDIHCDAGPAIIDADGTEVWYQHGVEHRDDGPAVIHANGGREWWRQGKLHRDPNDGPAIIDVDGNAEYYQNGHLCEQAFDCSGHC